MHHLFAFRLFFGDWPYVQVKEGIVRVYPPDGLGSGGGGSGGGGGGHGGK